MKLRLVWKRRTPTEQARHINRIIRTLILSDLFLLFGLGLLSPIYAVFVLQNIDSQLEVVGIAVSVYWTVRVLTVLPVSKLMDRLDGDRDEYAFMILGTFLMASVPLGYILASEPWHIYLLQGLNGAAAAMAIPSWRILFTRNVDAGAVGFEWSLDDVSVGIATALSALIGTVIADVFGFHALFISIFCFGLVAVGLLLSIYKHRKSTVWDALRKHRVERRA